MPSLEMRRISCLLRLSLLPEMGQRAQIFIDIRNTPSNVLVTFNAHLSLSDTLAFDSPSFLFFIPFCPVSHCLVLYFAIRFTFLCLHFVLMKSI